MFQSITFWRGERKAKRLCAQNKRENAVWQMVRLGWRKKPMSAKIKEKQLTNVKKRTDIDLEDEEEK